MSILRNPDGKEVNSSSEEQGRRASELSMEQKKEMPNSLWMSSITIQASLKIKKLL